MPLASQKCLTGQEAIVPCTYLTVVTALRIGVGSSSALLLSERHLYHLASTDLPSVLACNSSKLHCRLVLAIAVATTSSAQTSSSSCRPAIMCLKVHSWRLKSQGWSAEPVSNSCRERQSFTLQLVLWE